MKKLFDYKDCKDEKINERIFSQSLAVSVLCIMLCLVALCSMTYAWFSTSTISGQNTLKSGCFSFSIEVKEGADVEEGTEAKAVIDVYDQGNGVYTCEIPNGQTYEITLTPTAETNTKGHCAVTVERKTATYATTPAYAAQRTAQILPGTEGSTYAFRLCNDTEADMIVKFEVKWGIPANDDIKFGETNPYNVSTWPITTGDASSDQNP